MCIKAIGVGPSSLWLVLDCFKTQEMCNKVVRDGGLFFSQFLPDWFVTQQQLRQCDDDHDDDDKFFKWYKVK